MFKVKFRGVRGSYPIADKDFYNTEAILPV